MVGFLSIHLLIVDRIPRLGESRRDGVTASVVVRQWLEGGHWGDPQFRRIHQHQPTPELQLRQHKVASVPH